MMTIDEEGGFANDDVINIDNFLDIFQDFQKSFYQFFMIIKTFKVRRTVFKFSSKYVLKHKVKLLMV